MGYVEQNLLPNEQVLYKTRLHWILFVRPAALAVAGAGATAVLAAAPGPSWLWLLGLPVLVVGLGWLLGAAVELGTSEFAVTTARLVFKVGLIARYTTELLLPKVESIGVTQGLLGRLLNFGDLTVTGTGGAREVFRRVRDPIGFRNFVQYASTAPPPGPPGRPPST